MKKIILFIIIGFLILSSFGAADILQKETENSITNDVILFSNEKLLYRRW